MKAILNTMRQRKYGIPEDVLPLFEQISQDYTGNECEALFLKAMEEHLTEEQRFRVWEKNGGCQGTGNDKRRKAFALEHADIPVAERLKIYNSNAVWNDDNTFTIKFKCAHGYYKHAPKGHFHLPDSVHTYFERCAGGRLYEYQKALGVKLRIKSVDTSPLSENITNPVVFTFEIVD